MIKAIKISLLNRAAHLLLPYLKQENKRVLYASIKNRVLTTMVGSDFLLEGGEYIRIGDGFHAGNHFRLCAIDLYAGVEYSPMITIGQNVSFEDYCHVGCVERIDIGDGCMFASKVFIEDHTHGGVSPEELQKAPAERELKHKPVVIGNNVLCGDGVCILPGVTIGDNVIIGANAVVTKSFPANCVIAGVPAKIIRVIK